MCVCVRVCVCHQLSFPFQCLANVQIVLNRKATIGPDGLLLFTGTNETLPPFPVTTNEVRFTIRAKDQVCNQARK